MSFWTTLKRSQPTIHRLPSLHRLRYRPFSTPPPPSFIIPISNTNSSSFNSFLQWIAVGSSIGVAGYCLSSYTPICSDKSVLSFADWSTGATAEVSLADQLSSPKFLFADAYRRKIFFNYEKRIRMRSPPEKVFEYFASFRTLEGEIFMTPADLMRAVVPVFPPSDSHLVRDGYLRGERSPGELRCDPSEFFMLFDTNNDGLISFKEYIFFVTLLSIPESSFSVAFKMFDVDGSGSDFTEKIGGEEEERRRRRRFEVP